MRFLSLLIPIAGAIRARAEDLNLPSNLSDIDVVNGTNSCSNSTLSTVASQDFRVVPRNWGHQLRPSSCLVNTVYALGELALEDYERDIERPRTLRPPDFTDMFFGIVPDGETPMPHRYALLGIMKGLIYMVENKRFQEVTFDLEWKGELVGFVHFIYQAPSATTIAAIDSHPTLDSGREGPIRLSSNSTLSYGTPSLETPNSPSLKIDMTFRGPSIGMFSIFGLSLATLVEIAPHKSTEIIMEPIYWHSEERGLLVLFNPIQPPRTRPPFLRYEHIIRSLVQAPEFMLRVNNFGELDMELGVGHSLVGRGYILLRSKPDVADRANS